MNKAAVIVITFVISAVGFYWAVTTLSRMDTKSKRVRTSKNLSALKERLISNPDDTNAFNRLVAALDSPIRHERVTAASLLGQARIHGQAVASALAHALTNEDRYLSREAALSLRALGTEAKMAIPALVAALKFGNCDTAWFSAQTLGALRAEPSIVVPALVRCLNESNYGSDSKGSSHTQLAFEAVDSLASFGPLAREALTSLKEHLSTLDPTFRMHLAYAIRSIDAADSESMDILIALVEGEELSTKALTTIGRLGERARPAVSAIENYLKRATGPVERQHASSILDRLLGTNSISNHLEVK
jgi:HEAT repeat protein